MSKSLRLALALLTFAALALGGGALAAHDLTASLQGPSTALDNTSFNVTVRVDNFGDATTASADAQLFIDGAPNGTAFALGPLAAGENGTSVQSLSLPCGAHWVNLTVDPLDTVPETNESNNNASLQVVVLPFVNFSSQLSGDVGAMLLTLNATASHGCAPLNFTWQVGADTLYGDLVTYSPPAGNLTVNLTVRSSANTSLASTGSRTLEVPNAPPLLLVLVPDASISTLVPLSAGIEAVDNDGSIASYFVDYGDGNTTTLFPEANGYEYRSSGNFTFTVTVTDNLGATNTSAVALQVLNRPPVADSEFDLWYTEPGKTVKFNASHSSDPEAFPLTILWSFGDGSTASGALANHSYAEAGTYKVTLSVTDAAGASKTVEVSVHVERPASDGAIVIVGGAGLGAAAFLLLYLLMRRRKAGDSKPPAEDSSPKPPSP